MAELTENQKVAQKLLNKLKQWFRKREKKIKRIRVVTSKDSFWVSNPKKIKFWKTLAEKQATSTLRSSEGDNLPSIRITKVIHKGGN